MDHKGFLTALFDFSFSEFLTTKIIKVLYGLSLVADGILTLLIIIAAFSGRYGKANVGRGILTLILSPLIFLLYAMLARISLESLIVLFRIAENTGEMSKMSKQ